MGPAALGAPGATIWFTGLSGSGKSAIAVAAQRRLVAAGIPALCLDGDHLRQGLDADLGFSRAERKENVRRVGALACMLAEAGLVSVVSVISPYAEDRRHARVIHEVAGVAFMEVFVDTPLATCEARDPKGLYAAARAGALVGLSGIDDPYEAPERPDLVLGDPEAGIEAAAEAALALLAERVVLTGGGGTLVTRMTTVVASPRIQ